MYYFSKVERGITLFSHISSNHILNIYCPTQYNSFHIFGSIFQAHLALYSFSNGQIVPALRLLYRARYLALLICGDNHPDIALLDVSDRSNWNWLCNIFNPIFPIFIVVHFSSVFYFLQSNIALILHAAGEFRHSVRFLEHALALNIKYYGEKSLKVAVSYHLVARTQSCMGDFRSALNSEKETYAIYKQQVWITTLHYYFFVLIGHF